MQNSLADVEGLSSQLTECSEETFAVVGHFVKVEAAQLNRVPDTFV